MQMEEVIGKFDNARQQRDGSYLALCPAHDDNEPSLSISGGDDGRTLLHCHAGCPADAVCAAIGIGLNDLFADSPVSNPTSRRIEAEYDYRDSDGELLYQVVRFEGKDFRQRRQGGNGEWIWNLGGVDRILYRLPELEAADPARMVLIVEGEKAADQLTELGLVATTNSGGAGKWHVEGDHHIEPLRGRKAAVLPDNDEPGRKHARQVANSLLGVAAQVRVVNLPGLGHKEDVYDWIGNGGTVPDLKALVLDAPVITEPIPEWEAETLDYGCLPKDVRPDPRLAAEAGEWLDLYADYAAKKCPMTPRSFHQSAGLFLASVAIARRLVLPMAFGDIYPNIFIVWTAVTTLFRKTTALNLGRGVARRVFPHLLAAQEVTPEAFLSDLAGREPPHLDQLSEQDRLDWQMSRDYAAQRGWVLDEVSGLLSSAGRDYNAGLIEAIIRFYDCDEYYARHTRSQGRVIVRNSCLSLLGASTPAALSVHLTSERLWSMGWWPRFAILTPETERPEWRESEEVNEPPELVARLSRLYNQLPGATWPDPPEPIAVTLGDRVHGTWVRYNQALSYDMLTPDLDMRLWGTYGRLPTVGLKLAMILAALDWQDGAAPKIELPHLARAMLICEDWRASAHRALKVVTATEFDRQRVRILRQIGRAGQKGATTREICRAMQDKTPDAITNALRQMETAGEIEPQKRKTRGRSAVAYHIVAD